MRRLLVLGGGINQVPIYSAARCMGLSVIGIDPDPEAVALRHADASHVCDLGNFERCLQIARDARVDGVITIAADFPVPTLARLAEALELKGPSVEAAQHATDKRLMREALAAAGVPCPQSRSVRTFEECMQAAGELSGDIVVKPALSSGGRGVTAVAAHPPQDELLRAYDHATAHARRGVVLVEECVAGHEYSIESLTCGGQTQIVAITEKLTSGAPHFVELGHNQPADLSETARASLSRAAMAAIEALAIDDSAGHVEIRLSNAGPRVIEAAARLGGGFIASHLVRLSTGVDFLEAAIRVALGEDPRLATATLRGSAVRFIVSQPGRIEGIDGLCEAQQAPGVVEAMLYVDRGDVVPSLKDATARLGHVICTGTDRADAAHQAEAACRLVEISTS